MLSTRPPSLLKRLWLATLRPATVARALPPMAQQASTASAGRSAVRIPGPVETSMQTKVGLVRVLGRKSLCESCGTISWCSKGKVQRCGGKVGDVGWLRSTSLRSNLTPYLVEGGFTRRASV